MFERFEKMDRRTLVTIVIAVVAGLFFFGAIAGGIRQAGWNEGFLFGLLSGGAEGNAAVNPYLATRGYGMHGWGWHPFRVIGGFFHFLFFGFVFMMLFKFFAFRRWARHGGYPGSHGPWSHHGRHHWGEHDSQEHSGPQGQTQSQSRTPSSTDTPADDVNRPQPTSWTQI